MEEWRDSLRRPTTTQDALHRLKSSKIAGKEKEALLELCHSMVGIFHNDPQSKYVSEAAALAPVLRHNEELLTKLATTLGNTIIKGTVDGDIKEAGLLKAFAYVLWHTREMSTIRPTLSSVLKCLSTRLETARIGSDLETQYLIVCSISAILDSIIDIKVTGLGRESLHEPLIKQLKGLISHEDLRLSQISNYAYQACLGVKDDEGPFEVLWRHIQKTVQISAEITGAISGIDPGALLKSLPAASSIVDTVRKLIEFGENIADIMSNINVKEWADSLGELSRQKSWYKALRYVDLLLQSEAWSALRQFTAQVSCRNKIQFQIGIFVKLEEVWIVANREEKSSAKDGLLALYRQTCENMESTDFTVQAWARLVGTTIGSTSVSNATSSRFWARKSKAHLTSVATFFRWPGLDADTGALLGTAWLDTNNLRSKILYADLMIHEYYLSSKKLHIERLCGKLLPMDRCYINLAIQDRYMTKDIDHKSSAFSIKTRLRPEAPALNQRQSYSLPTILGTWKRGDDVNFKPRRIFIQGRAGVGKTTLCKKFVYEFINGTFQNEPYDRILWLPLRRLSESNGDGDSIWSRVLNDKLSLSGKDSKILAETLADQLDNNQEFRARTLLLLDGLDEIALRWSEDTHIHRWLTRLLNMPNVIVTSRPQGKVLEIRPFDLEFETVGFFPEEVQEYLQHCIEKQSTIDKINHFLAIRPLIGDLLRIPIQLDAFCSTWSSSNTDSTIEPSTMTLLYQSICRELNKKDVLRLEKEKALHSQNIKFLGSFEVETYLKHEQRFLEEFAFQGLYNNIIEFSPYHQEVIGRHLFSKGEQINGPYKIVLGKLSFLRSSGGDIEADYQYIHFLHLTFQEYFAAKHFVRHWNQGIRLECLGLNHNAKHMSPIEFLQQKKYNPRYNMFWRFVAGLLQSWAGSCLSNESLSDFFVQLNSSPCDILGYVHNRLLMDILAEVAVCHDQMVMTLRKSVECWLQNWAHVELKVYASQISETLDFTFKQHQPYIIFAEEFPENVLHELLIHENSDMRCQALRALTSPWRLYRTGPTTKAIQHALSHPNHDINFYRMVIGLQPSIHPHLQKTDANDALKSILKHSKDAETQWICKIVLERDGWAHRVTKTFLFVASFGCYPPDYRAWNNSGDPDDFLHELFKHISPLTKQNLLDLIKLLDSTYEMTLRVSTLLQVIYDRQTPEISLVDLFEGLESSVKISVMTTWAESKLNASQCALLTVLLIDSSSEVRLDALRILRGHSNCRHENFNQHLSFERPDVAPHSLLSLLSDESCAVQKEALLSMAHYTLSMEVQSLLISKLESAEPEIQDAATIALEGGSSGWGRGLAQSTIDTLIGMLTVSSCGTRSSVIRVLSSLRQPMQLRRNGVTSSLLPLFPESNLSTMLSIMKNSDDACLALIRKMFEKSHPLPLGILETVVTNISSCTEVVAMVCAQILQDVKDLPEEIMQTMEGWLQSSSVKLQASAVIAWARYGSSPRNELSAFSEFLNNSNLDTRVRTAIVSNMRRLPDYMVNHLTGWISDKTFPARIALIKLFLYTSPPPPDCVLDASLVVLEDEKDEEIVSILTEHWWKFPTRFDILIKLVGYGAATDWNLGEDFEAAWRRYSDQGPPASEGLTEEGPQRTLDEWVIYAAELIRLAKNCVTSRNKDNLFANCRIYDAAANILKGAKNLSSATIDSLIGVWDTIRLEQTRDDKVKTFIHDSVFLDMLASQQYLSQKASEKVSSILVEEYDIAAPAPEGKEASRLRPDEKVLTMAARIVVDAMRKGTYNPVTFLDILGRADRRTKEIILSEVVQQDFDRFVVSFLDRENLIILCLVWLRLAHAVGISCIDYVDGLYLKSGDQETRLNITAEQKDSIIETFRDPLAAFELNPDTDIDYSNQWLETEDSLYGDSSSSLAHFIVEVSQRPEIVPIAVSK